MATVGELIHSLNKADVMAALARLYTGEGEWPEGYEMVWDRLLAMQPKLTTISVYLAGSPSDDDPPEMWIDVSGRQDGSAENWAIEFVEWPEWLSMPVTVSPELADMPDVEKLAHCLYEMTWPGYNPEAIAEKLEDICSSVEEAKEALAGAETVQ
jgi:hypothetical protein